MKSYVFISGAAGGLGKAFAAECASRGWNLFLTDVSAGDLSILTSGLVRLYNVEIIYYPCNLTDPASRDELWKIIQQRNLRFHFLINVAGVDFEGPFIERTSAELGTIIRLNIESTVDMTSRALHFRDKTRMLRIINVSSLAGYYPMPVKAIYAASKRFLLDFSLALHHELAESGVTVTVLCPAGMPTTPSAISGIFAQGFMGRITTKNVGYVAAKTIDRALSGRMVYIPGVINRILRFLGGTVPPSLVAYFIGKRWLKIRHKYNGEILKGV